MLYTIAAVIIALWLIGLLAHVAGGFINLLLVAAAVVLVCDFVSKRNAR